MVVTLSLSLFSNGRNHHGADHVRDHLWHEASLPQAPYVEAVDVSLWGGPLSVPVSH